MSERCERCGQELRPGKEVWLELDTRTGRYHRPGEVPPEHNQGGFPFGPWCAVKQLRTRVRKG